MATEGQVNMAFKNNFNLARHRTVLYREPKGDTETSKYFEPLRDEENEIVEGYHMSPQDFVDFGEPEVITISVEPGDLLNGEGS